MFTCSSPRFARDSLTWLLYGLLAYYAYLQAALGPVMPFLREELDIGYTVGGLHPSAFAVGMIGAGLLGERVTRRWGRPRAVWGGALGMSVGALLLMSGRHIMLTLPAIFLMGFAGTLLLVLIQAVLADRHGEQRTTALTEANVAASMSATLAPLAVGTLASLGASWRGGLLLAVGFLVLLALPSRHITMPLSVNDNDESGGGGATRLPRRFWAFWMVLVLSVAAEWCVILWSVDFLEQVGGFSRNAATLWMSSFFVAAVAGRVVVSRLTRFVTGERLLLLAFVLAILGFLMFWQVPSPIGRVGGLFLTGLGIANLFPLTLSVSVGLAGPQSDMASARVALGAGTAILLAPLLLGGLADQWGLHHAFTIVGSLLGGALVVAYIASRELQRDTRAVDVHLLECNP